MSARTLQVLGVDDSADDLVLLERALRHCPELKLAAKASDGMEAISYLKGEAPFSDRDQWPLPDVLLLDIKMPRLDGFGVLAWLAGQSPRPCTTVIVLTGSLSETDRIRALQFGAKAVHIKPVHPAEYRALVRQLVQEANERE